MIIMGANIFSMHPLPEAGVVSIGRDDDDDVRIDEPNASRHHARLHVGAVLEIEDTGSTNGTRLRGNLLQPGQRVPVLPGEAISIGWATLIRIQQHRPTMRMRRLPTHAFFEGRLEEECDKASSSGRVFAVLRLHVAPRDVARGGRGEGVAARAAGRRAGVVRPGRIRDDPVRTRRQAGGRIRRAHRRAAGCRRRRRAHRRRLLPGEAHCFR